MTFERFHNALRVMRNIDWHELEAAGVHLRDAGWVRFRDDPYGSFIRMSDADARAIWQIIEARQGRPDPAVEALRDLVDQYDPERGVIDAHPDGGCIMCCSIRPNVYDTGLCPYHEALEIVEQADWRASRGLR